jgi:hypothetical protein
MLRYSLMPSDFHPHVLVLGENEDIDRLALVLRTFAAAQRDVDLNDEFFVRSPDTRLRITATPGARGIHSRAEEPYDLVWRLDAEQASSFATRLSDLAAQDLLSGSEHLDCEVQGEIPVWVSKGEFAEGFLKT